MNKAKKARLEAAGWRVGSVADFLGLSRDEAAFVDMKFALAQTLRKRRRAKGLTQGELATELGSSQSRVAKMETADASVTLDLLVRALLAMGTSRAQLARAIGRRRSSRAA